MSAQLKVLEYLLKSKYYSTIHGQEKKNKLLAELKIVSFQCKNLLKTNLQEEIMN